MPEGNELHRFAEQQGEKFSGHQVKVDAPNGRFEEGAALLTGRKLLAVDAFGKHLFYNFGRDRQLHVHLGLFGRFRDGAMPHPEPKGALRLRISDEQHWIELRGPTACEVLNDTKRDELLARIGPDPLREDAKPAAVIARIQRSKSSIGLLLMDQSVIGGIGNIYRAELLFRAGLSPFQTGASVEKKRLNKLWRDAKALMLAGMKDRRIVTTDPKDRPHSTGRARSGEAHYAYHRTGKPCFRCGTAIKSAPMAGRTLYWCPQCQAGLP